MTPGLAVLKFGVTYTVLAAASPDAQLELLVGSPIVCPFLSGIDIGRTEGVPAAPPGISGVTNACSDDGLVLHAEYERV